MDASKILATAAVVPVVVIDDAEVAVELATTLEAAGLAFIEITLRTPAALTAIEKIAREVSGITVGAGSVRRVSQLAEAKSAGAKFAVCPGSSDALLDAVAQAEMPFVPGAVTPSESLRLLEHGYTLQKFFPAELAGGMAMLQAIGAPIPEARFFPTGGISVSSASEYLALPNVACIGGSWIAPSALLRKRDFGSIDALARGAANLTV